MKMWRAKSIRFGGRALNRTVVVMDPNGSTQFESTVFKYSGSGATESNLPKKGIEATLEIKYEIGKGSGSLVKKAAFYDIDQAGRMEFIANIEGYTVTV